MRRILIASTICVALATHAFCDEEERRPEFVRIPNQTMKILTSEVVPLLEAGNTEAASDLLMVILGKVDPKVVKSIDKHLLDKGLPAGSALFTDRVLRRVEAGLVDLKKAPSSSELAMLVPEMANRIDKVVSSAKSHPQVKGSEKLPADWNEAEEFFWDFHVMKNELNGMIRLGEFGKQITKKYLKSKNRDLVVAEKAEEFPELVQQLTAIKQQVIEQEALYRHQQMTESIAQIESASDFREAFIGMTSLQSARLFFIDFFAAYEPVDFKDPLLATDTFESSVTEKILTTQDSKPALVEKVVLFQEGLHWWFRGRYGAGALATGLLKSPEAIESPDAMFGLYMPRKRPVPTAAFSRTDGYADPVPEHQRRHYYTWAIGHQEFLDSSRKASTSRSKNVATETTTLNTFY